ncbi:MAG: hypothetical protein MUC72_11415 [Acidobacteria bacterium]|nr:hypothetical protein [Acidobacteriota bacterium]
MKKQALAFWGLLTFIIAPSLGAAAAPALDPAALFPGLEGWSKDGAMQLFGPENLYEHINGAAENFMAYGFERLAVQNYVNKERQALIAEIYFHGTPENAFGIYGSEKPLAGDYLAIGSEGYAEEGVLNFISDACYVKLNSFDLGGAGAGVLKSLAEKIAGAINGSNTLPPALAAFPAAGRIARSERYFLGNFLGLDFLGPAFVADYERAGKRFRLFLMTPADPAALLRRWAALDKGFAGAVAPGNLLINDPYNGPVSVSWHEGRVWGGVGQGEEMEALIRDLGANLMGKQEK